MTMTINTMQERQLRKERAALSLLAVASASACTGVRPFNSGLGPRGTARMNTLQAGVMTGSEQPVRQHGWQMRMACGDIATASSKEERSPRISWGRDAGGQREEMRCFHDCGDRHGADAFPGIAYTTPWGLSRYGVTG